MHAGEASKGRCQRAKGGKIPANRVEPAKKGKKMHAGEAGNGRERRAKGGKIPAGRVEPAKPAEKGEEKYTPARRATAGASVQKEAKSPPAEWSRPNRRRKGKKNARRRGGQRQEPACKGR